MSARWMNWTPKNPISTDSSRLEPTKPSKPGSVGFVGAHNEESPKITSGRTAGSSDLDINRTQGLAAVDLLNRSGARLLPHSRRTVAVPSRYDTPDLRRALALLGYGSYSVAHLDTDAYRGQGINVIEAALQTAGVLPC